MRAHPVQASILIAFLAGCGAQPPANDMANMAAPPSVTNDATSAAAPAGPTGEEGLRQFAECSATFEAMARLFEAVANTSSGPEAEDARSTASARRGAAAYAATRAGEIATQLGRGLEAVDRIKAERHAAMERERARQDFGDFAIWLGRESDRCAALDPSYR